MLKSLIPSVVIILRVGFCVDDGWTMAVVVARSDVVFGT